MEVAAGGGDALQKGDVVCFGERRTGTVTRAYPTEDKYAVREVGALRELRGSDNSFFYFSRRDLKRAVPLPPEEAAAAAAAAAEPDAKQPRLDSPEVAGAAGAGGLDGSHFADGEEPAAAAALQGPKRPQGRVKWYSREKGFGKIAPFASAGQPAAEEVFVHRNRMDGGPDGPHAQAMCEGAIVTYDLTTHTDGQPCASEVQVEGVAGAAPLDPATAAQREELIRHLLLSGLQHGAHQVKGQGKAAMEDRLVARPGVPAEALGGCRRAVCGLFGVFDGHSGASCSEFVATCLDRSVFDCLRHQSRREVSCEMSVRSALLSAFRMTEHNFFQYLNKLEGSAAHAWATAGSTACAALFFGPDEEGRLRLAVANAGDSRCVLGKISGRAVRLSEDHTPDVPAERKRIEKEGASVVQQSNGIWRIVLPTRRGAGSIAGLSVSRGFGDLEYKQPNPVVTAVPDVSLLTVDLRDDSFILLASDGVWNSVSDAEAAQIAASCLRSGGDEPAKAAARQLVETAHQRDSADDKTAVVVWFGDLPAAAALPITTTQAVSSRTQTRAATATATTRTSRSGGGDDMFTPATFKRQAPPLVTASWAQPLASPPGHPAAAGFAAPAVAGQEHQDLDRMLSAFAREMG